MVRGRVATTADPGDDFLLKVERPKFTEPPRVSPILTGWLKPGWNNPESSPEFKTENHGLDPNGDPALLKFEDDSKRVAERTRWTTSWQAWAVPEAIARRAFRVFEKLYELHGQLQRESEKFEMMAGDGLLSWRRPEGTVQHPILLQRLVMEFDPGAAVFTISQTEHPPEIYTALLRHIPDVPGKVLADLRTEVDLAARGASA